uniref:Uncharacterized protein n=1 Tax=Utricularia reniformis TaxID=192314 RepID=A0A1Y0B2V6_9LAMI|nr:hypothetical protein AEK19_MT1543 [Utricularia reniformis]ART31730.1 hypothetical protein AEK19_MT1543 [Utricularia reniformis]
MPKEESKLIVYSFEPGPVMVMERFTKASVFDARKPKPDIALCSY